MAVETLTAINHNSNMEKKMAESPKKKFRVTKSCARQVSLKGVTSQYDNIKCGNEIQSMIEVTDMEDLKRKLKNLTDLVQKETERDMYEEIKRVIEMTQDKKNSALVGIGSTLEMTETVKKQVQGWEEVKIEEVEMPDELEEVDIESFD